MDVYDPSTVFSSIDRQGRYAYANQPPIAAWNLARLADALLPLLHSNEAQALRLAEDVISGFQKLYQSTWLAGMRAKLGLFNEEAADETLVANLLTMMEKYRADYTNTFRLLTLGMHEDAGMMQTTDFAHWRDSWRARLGRQQQAEDKWRQLMKDNNPAVIPRNHRVEEALASAVEYADYRGINRLLAVLAKPYAYTPEQAEYAALPVPSTVPYQTFCGT